MFNKTKEDVNTYIRLIQENPMAFHRKAQVWKAKLQSCPEPSKIGHVMYGANNIQVSNLITKIIVFIERDRKCKIEIAVQLEASFQTDQERKYPSKTITGMKMKKNISKS